MGTIYYPAGEDVRLLVAARLAAAHHDMHSIGVRVGVLMASNDAGPAVKLHGSPCNATIRVVPHKDRVTKGYDAEMVIDSRNWDDFTPRQRQALIAHELHHLTLVVKVDKETGRRVTLYDDGGRPKLKTRPGDWDAGDGFVQIVAEFGDDAIEYHNIRSAWGLADQAKLIGAPEPKPAPSLLDEVELEEPEPEPVRTASMAAAFSARVKNGDSPTAGPRGEVAADGEREAVAEGDARYHRGGGRDA